MNHNEIIEKRLYRHFKGNLYYINFIATHSETEEKMVCYQAQYGDYGMFVRPLSMFLEEVPKDRNDNIFNQKYRFELYK